MPANPPSVTIIVPCRNERAHIEAAVMSMLAQVDVPGPLEVIVADGESDDGTRTILDRIAANDARLRVINNPKRVVSPGLNAAIRAAQGDIIIRMDTHSIYAPDYVAQCVVALQASGAQNVGGPARTRAESYFQQANAIAYHSPFSVGGARFHDVNYEGWVDTVTYGCWRKSTLLDLGLFDDALVRNQDDEFNLRLTRSGGRIWQTPNIKSWYFPRDTLIKLFRQYMQYGYWKVRVIQKHRIPASIRHLVPGGFVAAVLLLAGLSPFFSAAFLGLKVLVSTYLAVNAVVSVLSCRQMTRWKYIPIMPMVFGAYHLGYGWGFLRGVVDFVVRSRGGAKQYTDLTR